MNENCILTRDMCSSMMDRRETGGICVYAEQFGNQIEESGLELITAARQLSAQSGEPITALVLGEDPEALARQLAFPDVEVAAVPTGISALQDDALCVCVAAALEQLAPSIVLIPANRTCRALFSRVAARMNLGLTADCSELFFDEGGEFLQRKSAFGENAMCVTAEIGAPKLVTVQVGVHPPASAEEGAGTLRILEVPEPVSGVEVCEVVESTEESITGAERILSLGRGVLEGDNLSEAGRLAEKLGAMIGGTRPLVDDGTIPFERQIGQTGCTVHPKICLYFGVSGAIQHTEGVRDTKLTIAVNKDPEAGIFGYVDYGVAADMSEILKELIRAYS